MKNINIETKRKLAHKLINLIDELLCLSLKPNATHLTKTWHKCTKLRDEIADINAFFRVCKRYKL